MNMWSPEIMHASIVGGIFLVIFSVAEIWRKVGNPQTELTRKFVHFAAGAVCLSFSYLFHNSLTVAILCVAFVTIMFVTKKTGLLSSVHGVERHSHGGIYYPVAILLSFVISLHAKRPEFYCIGILVLALSDSLAALVGGRYGFKLYKVEEDSKSLEGSIIFFFSTFMIIHLGLLLLSQTGRAECVAAALYIALLITAFEAISLGGSDNLFIPIGTITILIRLADSNITAIVLRLATVIVIFFIILLIVRKTKLIGISGIIGVALMAYCSVILARPDWIFPLVAGVGLFCLTDLFIESKSVGQKQYRIRSVFYCLIVSFIWVLAAGLLPIRSEVFFASYAINLCSNLGILWHRKVLVDPQGYHFSFTKPFRKIPLLGRSALLTMILIMANLFVDHQLSPVFTIASCFIGTTVIEIIYWQLEKANRGKWSDNNFLKATAVVAFSVSGIVCLIASLIYSQNISFLRLIHVH